MSKVLIPFTDPDSAERAIRQLLQEDAKGPLDVELLAITDAPELHSARRFVSPRAAEEAARAAAICWLARLGPMLQAAHVPYHTVIIVGDPAAEIEAALHRTDVDRVLLPSTAPHWPGKAPPVTLVA